MIDNVILVILSFFASLGFAIVFRIERKFLLYAGLGGGLTRIVYLILMQLTDNRAIYMMFAAMFAAAYAEFLAPKMKTPSTVFLYPSIIPLIPGDLLYNTIVGLVLHDSAAFKSNGISCAIALIWMSIGFVLISTMNYYWRRHELRTLYAKLNALPTSEASRRISEERMVEDGLAKEAIRGKIRSLEKGMNPEDK